MIILEHFEDVAKLDSIWLGPLIDKLSWRTLVAAYAFSDEKSREVIMSFLSERGKKIFLKKSSKMKVSKYRCERAQQKILLKLMQVSKRGMII